MEGARGQGGLTRDELRLRSWQDIAKGITYIYIYILPKKLNTPRFYKTKPISPLESTNISRGGRIIDTNTWILPINDVIPFRISEFPAEGGELTELAQIKLGCTKVRAKRTMPQCGIRYTSAIAMWPAIYFLRGCRPFASQDFKGVFPMESGVRSKMG
jgi:hypothetical protein